MCFGCSVAHQSLCAEGKHKVIHEGVNTRGLNHGLDLLVRAICLHYLGETMVHCSFRCCWTEDAQNLEKDDNQLQEGSGVPDQEQPQAILFCHMAGWNMELGFLWFKNIFPRIQWSWYRKSFQTEFQAFTQVRFQVCGPPQNPRLLLGNICSENLSGTQPRVTNGSEGPGRFYGLFSFLRSNLYPQHEASMTKRRR